MIENARAHINAQDKSNYTHALEYCEHVGTLADDVELETLLSNHSNISNEYWLPIKTHIFLKWNITGGTLRILIQCFAFKYGPIT